MIVTPEGIFKPITNEASLASAILRRDVYDIRLDKNGIPRAQKRWLTFEEFSWAWDTNIGDSFISVTPKKKAETKEPLNFVI